MENITNEKNVTNANQEEIMNRVNQTFEQMVQDVKNMIDENNQDKNNSLT